MSVSYTSKLMNASARLSSSSNIGEEIMRATNREMAYSDRLGKENVRVKDGEMGRRKAYSNRGLWMDWWLTLGCCNIFVKLRKKPLMLMKQITHDFQIRAEKSFRI